MVAVDGIANRGAPPPLQYRPDIDGLRAVAVLAVIAYHFFPAAFPAGFIGVDVFFVVSGYLISGIILAGVDAGNFSISEFYGRRVRRIFPALIIVLLASLAMGWALLYSAEYKQLGTHVASGAGFLSNIVLWLETGYFDAAAETKPLLHLWSLGVEEQFYLVWPLLLVALGARRTGRVRLTVALLVASIAASLYVTAHSQPSAFYLPWFRFWELMAGALLVQLPAADSQSKGESELRSYGGLALLAASFAVIEPGASFPGWRALLPVAGTYLIISAGPGASFNRLVLSRRTLVGIGLVSFPLYLWHWPLLSFFRIVSNDAPVTAARGAVLFAASLALAWLTYAVVEKPIRHGGRGRAKAIGLAAAMVFVGVLGVTVKANEGWAARQVNARDPTFATRDGRNAPDVREWIVDDCRLPAEQAKAFRRCTRDARGTERYALIGDSKAEALFAGIVRTSTADGRWLFIGGSTHHDSVLPVVSDADHYSTYRGPARLSLLAVQRNPHVQTVVLAASARAFFHLRNDSSIEDLPASIYYPAAHGGLSAYVRELLAAGKRVVLVVDNPTLPDPKRCMADARITASSPLADFLSIGKPDSRCTITLQRQNELAAQYLKLLREVVSIDPARVSVFETMPHLCDMGAGICGAYDGDKLLYSFSDHVSDYASTKIGKALNERLAELDHDGTTKGASRARIAATE